ncbi:CYTH domain-containing protein [Treponema brennaborense]|uniref:Adenylate cyclase n=1 Tax=Treponema brennaborense (strain DSM 12168 / CIP 105900 / DD5/3) TaxID=906968 RepID=F4LPZ3_TREBD|nr:CYTH domain-containing protein [Treponema brennaborense]AEE16085.1 adenylate cyclase [Treponema brennaborense DSM 12168]
MYEIELKAHVYDREQTITQLNGFAAFKKACQKTDTYWKHSATGVQIRIREEIPLELSDELPGANGGVSAERGAGTPEEPGSIIVTYKRKELRTAADGAAFEVNDEQEFTINTRLPFETFLKDSGFTVAVRKLKTVYQWKTAGTLIELCTVPPIGDFIEIEINEESNLPHVVSAAKTELMDTLRKCGIGTECIESRYYSEMLANADGKAGFGR